MSIIDWLGYNALNESRWDVNKKKNVQPVILILFFLQYQIKPKFLQHLQNIAFALFSWNVIYYHSNFIVIHRGQWLMNMSKKVGIPVPNFFSFNITKSLVLIFWYPSSNENFTLIHWKFWPVDCLIVQKTGLLSRWQANFLSKNTLKFDVFNNVDMKKQVAEKWFCIHKSSKKIVAIN